MKLCTKQQATLGCTGRSCHEEGKKKEEGLERGLGGFLATAALPEGTGSLPGTTVVAQLSALQSQGT